MFLFTEGMWNELSYIADSLERCQRGMLTGSRPLDGISTSQCACAYHNVLDMLVLVQFAVYLSEMTGLRKQV